MTDDLTTRLREDTSYDPTILMRDAADEIDSLRAELDRRTHPGQGEGYALEEDRLQAVVSGLQAALRARDAQIAEARERLHAGSVPLGMSETAFLQKSILDALAILSRGSQGAAESSDQATVKQSPENLNAGGADSSSVEPWTDPEPWLTTGRNPERFAWPRSDGSYLPRTHEQFDAEQEANHGER